MLLFSTLNSFKYLSSRFMMSSSYTYIPQLLSASDSLKLYQNPSIKFLDGSWHLNKATRNSRKEFENLRIPESQLFDIDEICDQNNPLPHMLPSESQFSDQVSSLGISSDDHIIIYVQRDSFSAARVWWMFRAFGHEKVSLLDGGIQAWIDAGGPIETSPPVEKPKKGNFNGKLNKSLVVELEEVVKAVNEGSSQIADARSYARFMGQAPEPRAGLESGHIPGSLSLPFTAFVREDDITKFKSVSDIENAFKEAGVVLGSRVIATCGSGVSAAVLCFGFNLIRENQLNKIPIYDGSWSEWGSRPDLPKINPSIDKSNNL